MVTPEALDAIREKYQILYPKFELTARELHDETERLLRTHGIAPANIEARAKEVSSLLKKVFQKGYANPWDDVTDKIGIRITTVHPADVTAVVDTFKESEFKIIKIENKRGALDPTTLGYLATHLDVRFSVRNGLDERDCRLEVQVRTAAESAWAYAAHDLMFKAPHECSATWQRSTYRLLALVELFDCEVKRLQEEIMAEPTYAVGRVLSVLEREFFRLTAVDYNRELSRDIIGTLINLMADKDRAAPSQAFRGFVDAHRNKLSGLYRAYLSDHRHILMSQPESILIFFLLERDKFTLGEAWQKALPPVYLERLSEVWGRPVDLSARE